MLYSKSLCQKRSLFKNKTESRTGTYHDQENDCKKGFQLPGSVISYLALKEGRKEEKEEKEEKGRERKKW